MDKNVAKERQYFVFNFRNCSIKYTKHEMIYYFEFTKEVFTAIWQNFKKMKTKEELLGIVYYIQMNCTEHRTI